jgi:hypothetical protein
VLVFKDDDENTVEGFFVHLFYSLQNLSGSKRIPIRRPGSFIAAPSCYDKSHLFISVEEKKGRRAVYSIRIQKG